MRMRPWLAASAPQKLLVDFELRTNTFGQSTNVGLTDARLRALKGQDRSYKLADGEGLQVLVPPKGSKHWRLRA